MESFEGSNLSDHRLFRSIESFESSDFRGIESFKAFNFRGNISKYHIHVFFWTRSNCHIFSQTSGACYFCELDKKWHWNLFIFCSCYVFSWFVFACLWFIIALIHGDLNMYGSNSSMGYDGNSTMTPYGNDTINDSASAFHECLSSVDNYNRGMFRNIFRKHEFSGNLGFSGNYQSMARNFEEFISKHEKNYNH